MERPRGLPENPAQGRRAAAAAAANQYPPSSSQVIGMAREAMRAALEEHETQAAEASGVSNELKPGVTIDLSRKHITKLPDEVVDIIKTELERWADLVLPPG